MKKKWLTLPVALIMAGTLAFGASCGPTAPTGPVITVQDGFIYVDGVRTDIQVSDYSSGKSVFEQWKKENPSYEGTEEDWVKWLQQLLEQAGNNDDDDDGNDDDDNDDDDDKETKVIEYKIIENGVLSGEVASGSASTASSALKMTNAILNLSESVILPVGEGAKWEVDITGKLLTGSATGAQLLVANPFSEFGRVYIGVNKNSSLIYLGVRMNTVYINYGWTLSSSLFTSNHSYAFIYEDGVYYLSVDGQTKQPMTDVNFNQANGQWLEDPEADSQNLNTLIHTVLGQEYIEMTNIGVNEFTCNAEISSFTVKTTEATGYKKLEAHPLKDTRIFYLGSSITYGSASGGVAFGDIIGKISGNPYQKQAVSGTTLAKQNGRTDSYVERFNNFNFNEKPDFLIVQLSTNDFSTGRPLGTVDMNQTSGFDTFTLSGAIEHIISQAKAKCPTVKVVFYAGAVKGSWGYRTAYENYMQGDLQKICEKWNIGVLDIFHTKYKSYNCYWNDDIHPTIEGYCAGWTPLFVKYLEENL